MIGVFSDSYGDLGAFERAYELLKGKGAKRFFFMGGRYSDLDAWITERGERARGGRAYSDNDFLADVSLWLTANKEPGTRPAAFGEEEPEAPGSENLALVKGAFVRVPEKDSLQYRDPSVPTKLMDMLGSTLCCLVHDKNDLERDDLLNANVFIHGKEPEPKVVQIGPRFFVTPGKLTGSAEQTCALLELIDKDKTLKFSAFTLQGRTVVDGQSFPLERRTKLSVK